MLYLRNLRYILLHKWYVFVACCRLGVWWRGLWHDWSKFLPDEFVAYARFFYGSTSRTDAPRGQVTACAPEVEAAFDRAWLRHQHRHDHHWQHWVLHNDDGELKVLPMSHRARREMLADWTGAGRARGFTDPRGWYLRNREHILLHPETRAWLEWQLGITE